MDILKITAALAALGHEHRLRIYHLLVEFGLDGLSVSEIGEQVGLQGATLNFHLNQLKQANLVIARKEGRQIFHVVDYEFMHEIVGYLTENCCKKGRKCQ